MSSTLALERDALGRGSCSDSGLFGSWAGSADFGADGGECSTERRCGAMRVGNSSGLGSGGATTGGDATAGVALA